MTNCDCPLGTVHRADCDFWGNKKLIPVPAKQNVRILLNNNVKMTPGKAAAQAVHAALLAYGIEHGSVVVLQGSKVKIEAMDVQVRDAGLTELKPGTLTAGASLEG